MIKKYKEKFNITINAGQASPTPPIGPMLGQRGINIMEFSKEFNNITKNIKEDIKIPVSITLNKNRTFALNTRLPVSSHILKKIVNISKGSSNTKHNMIAKIKIQDIYETVTKLNPKMNELEIYDLCKKYISSASSIGIAITK